MPAGVKVRERVSPLPFLIHRLDPQPEIQILSGRAISVATWRNSNGLIPLPSIILLQSVLQRRNLTPFASAAPDSLALSALRR